MTESKLILVIDMQAELIRNEHEWLANKRKEAAQLFQTLDMPRLKHGLNVETNFAVDFDKIEPAGFKPQIIASGADVIPLSEALQSHGDIIKKFFASGIAPSNKLLAFHYANFGCGTFVYVPRGSEATIQAVYDVAGSQLDYTLIAMEANSSATLVEKHNSRCDYRSGITEAFLAEGSQLSHASLQQLGACSNYSVKKATLEKDAHIKWLDCALGSAITLSEIITHLRGRGSSVKNLGVFYGSDSQHFDLYANTIHDAPNTECDMLTRGVLQDSASAICRGLIEVCENAPQSNSYQKEDILLLSDKARAVPVPKLDIKNNNVRCTHGATVGQINQEQLFYLMSRGLSRDDAKKIIVAGFFEAVLKQTAADDVKAGVRDFVAAILK